VKYNPFLKKILPVPSTSILLKLGLDNSISSGLKLQKSMERLDRLQIWCGDGGIGKNLCPLTGYSDSTIHTASQLTTAMEIYIREFVCKIKFVRKPVNASHQE
jgi:hypothetical protein